VVARKWEIKKCNYIHYNIAWHESKSKSLSVMQKKKKLKMMSGRDEKKTFNFIHPVNFFDDEKKKKCWIMRETTAKPRSL